MVFFLRIKKRATLEEKNQALNLRVLFDDFGSKRTRRFKSFILSSNSTSTSTSTSSLSLRHHMHTLSIPYAYPIDTISDCKTELQKSIQSVNGGGLCVRHKSGDKGLSYLVPVILQEDRLYQELSAMLTVACSGKINRH